MLAFSFYKENPPPLPTMGLDLTRGGLARRSRTMHRQVEPCTASGLRAKNVNVHSTLTHKPSNYLIRRRAHSQTENTLWNTV